LMVAILTGVRWNLNMVFICVLLWPGMLSIHVFFFFSAIWTSSFEKALLSSFAHFFIVSLIFWGV
jgi:hypothetical protein